MKHIIVIILSLVFHLPILAQNHEIMDGNIRTLQVVAGNRWTDMPLIKLNGTRTNDVLNISFDDMTHDYRRFSYKVQHCEADWSPSESLFESDFMEGFYDGLTIDDVQESINTQMLYTHYKFTFPNSNCRLKMSGNYILTIYDDNADEPVVKVCFMVSEEKAQVMLSMTPNTDIDNRKSHQQIGMQLRYSGISPTRPDNQIRTVVLQNQQWATAKWNAPWQFVTMQGLEWQHCKDLIFDAGNEYHKYEILSVDHTTMGLDRIFWDGTNYHVYPWAVAPQYSYLYEEDANGAFYIRNSDNYENDFSTEYVFVHYSFAADRPVEGDVFIDGNFTYGQYSPDFNMMQYNPETSCYEAVMIQKQGYYNYKFMQQLPDGTIRNLPLDGNFYETENSYQALVYFKDATDRADRLVGFCTIGGK
ncbi:MAG: DUF5103 domain-containing protein [Bacteroidaceae bacterium]|nr:DUF5103 domain-containing protein [Bacteroidaceae bacterium]